MCVLLEVELVQVDAGDEVVVVVSQQLQLVGLVQDRVDLLEVAVQDDAGLFRLLDLLEKRPVVLAVLCQLHVLHRHVTEGLGQADELLQPDEALLVLVEDDEALPADLPHEVGEGAAQDGGVRVQADAEVGPLEVVVPAGLHEGHVEGVADRLDVVGGDGGGGAEDGGHPGLDDLAELPAGLEAVVPGVGAHGGVDQGAGQDGPVVVDHLDGAEEGLLLGLRVLVEERS